MESRFKDCEPRQLVGLIDTEAVGPGEPVRETPGQRIGHYQLLQQIGEGGMGVVFMAEQEKPLRRRVALKIIKPGMDTRQVIARFDAERQALALMDHPNIAHVYDAGSTESGRPFFVMELVRGTPITEYCDKHQLTTKERLELLVQVCQAVQHAHSKGIIHRDLKPNNVLVTIADGKPIPKVIDFGVAKATQSRLTEKTLFTEFRQLIGTPQYMSPEQAESDGIDIDTRSDVYSLGVLMYELLTGTTPLDGKELRSKAYREMERMIRETEAPRPSARLSTMGDAVTAIATCRRTEPAKLGQLLRGELDWIVMRCLEKDRSRRYETATSFARDIQRYLSDEPVEACPPSARYRLHKFVHKHRLPLGVAAGFAIVLVAATIVSAWQAVRATRARNAEARATASEAAQRKQAEAVAELLESVFGGLDPYVEKKGGPDLKTQLVAQLDQTAANLDKDYAGEPLVRARLRNTLGWSQLRLGEAGKAEALFQAALDEQRSHGAAEDPRTLKSLMGLALTNREAGRTTEAIRLYEQVRDLRTKILGPDHLDTLGTLMGLALAYRDAGRTVEAIELLERVRDRHIKTIGLDRPRTLVTLMHLGDAFLEAGRTAEAIELLEQVRDRQVTKLGPDDPQTLDTLMTLANAYKAAGRPAEAIKLLEHVRNQQIKTFGPDHPVTLATLMNLANAYENAGRTGQAITLFERVRDVQITKLGPDHPETLKVLVNLAITYEDAGRTEEAIKLYEEVRDRQIKKLSPDHPHTLATLMNLANAYQDAGRLEEAITLYEKVRDRQIETLGPDRPDTLETLTNLANAYTNAGRLDEAIALYEQVRDRQIKKLGPDHPNTLRTLMNLGNAYRIVGRTAEAIKLLEQVCDEQIKKLGPDHSDTLSTLMNIAVAYQRANRMDEAIKLYEQVRERRIKTVGLDHPDTLHTLTNLALVYHDAGRTDEAINLLEQVRDRQIRAVGPDHPATLRTLYGLAFVYQSAGRMGEAIKLIEQVRDQEAKKWTRKGRAVVEADVAAKSAQITAFGQADPKLAPALLDRARLYLRLSTFKDAAADLGAVTRLGSDDIMAPYYRGCLLAYLGDAAAYQVSCQKMFEQFSGSSDGPILDKIAKTCLLLPDGAGGDPKQMLALIERAMNGPHHEQLWAWYCQAKMLALYRLGNFSGCLEWSEQVRAADHIETAARTASAELLSAMAHQKLSHPDQARAAFQRAERRAEKNLFKTGEGDLDWCGVENWLFYQTLHREVESLIDGKAPSTQPIAH